jgi:hypothetical protein
MTSAVGWFAGLAAAVFLLSSSAAAQDAPLPVPPRPDAVESGGTDLPHVVPYGEAEKLLRRRTAPASAAPAEPPAASGTSRTIPVDPPPKANTSSRFVFRDATTRPSPRTRTLAEREATVDAIRRGFAPEGPER